MPRRLETPETYLDTRALILALGGPTRVPELFRKHKQPVPTEGQIISWGYRFQIPIQWLSALALIYETERKTPLIIRNFVKIGIPPYPRMGVPPIPFPNLRPMLSRLKRMNKVLVEKVGDPEKEIEVKRDRQKKIRDAKRVAKITDPFAPVVAPAASPPPAAPASSAPAPVPEATPTGPNILEEAQEIVRQRRVIDF